MTVNLRVIRGAGATGIGAGTGPTEALAQAPGTYSFPARLSVQAGDRVGFDLRFAPGDLLLLSGVKGGSGSYTGVVAGGIWPDGGSPASYQSFDGGPPSFATPVYLPMNVTVEPDVDGDGYGDEAQDGCPSSPASHGALPAAGRYERSRDNDHEAAEEEVGEEEGDVRFRVIRGRIDL